MSSIVQIQTPAEQIAELQARVRSAEQRAEVAEEQLRRVHHAVREFKQKQMQARAAQIRAQQEAATQQRAAQVAASQQPKSGFYAALADADPTLDERLEEYLQSDLEPDRARNWMLGS